MSQKSNEARKRFAANVERLRRQHDYSVEQLAERSELGAAEVAAILRGETEARVESIYRLAGALGVPPEKLYEGVTWIPDGAGGGEFRIDRPAQD